MRLRTTASPLTLWQYARPVAAGEPDQGEVAAALTAVHEALVGFPGSLPTFSLELEDARRLLRPERSSVLTPADRSFLRGVLDEVQGALPALVSDSRPLHFEVAHVHLKLLCGEPPD